MYFELENKVLDLKGTAVKDEKGMDVTVKNVLLDALTSPIQNEAGDHKFKKYSIAKKIFDNEREDGWTELTIEEVSLVKELVGKMYAPIIVGFIWNFLEGKTHKLKLAEVKSNDPEPEKGN